MNTSYNLQQLSEKLSCSKKQLILGLMSGSSADGLDIALVEFTNQQNNLQIKLLGFKTYEYSKNIRRRLLAAENYHVGQLSELHYDLGKLHCTMCQHFIKDKSLATSNILAIATHGHTVAHCHRKYSLQISQPDFMAYTLKLPVVYDFRSADIAAGGSGAPLVPYLDYILAQNKPRPIAFHNLGGISNFTYIDSTDKLQATDTGPANMMSNCIINITSKGRYSHDHSGQLAASGQVDEQLVNELLKQPFFDDTYPKSAASEQFGFKFCQYIINKYKHLSAADLLCSSLKFAALAIKKSYQDLAVANDCRCYFSGGGVYNKTLWQFIAEALHPRPVYWLNSDFEIDVDSKEAVCFALLGRQRLIGITSNVPTVTLADKKVVLGKIALPG